MPTPLLEHVAIEFAEKNNLADVAFRGKGSFKETYSATIPSGELIALKILDPQKCNLQRSAREIQAMEKCDTPLIAKLYGHGSFSARNGESFHFFLEEYMGGGSLSEQLSKGALAPEIIRKYTISLVEALDYLRERDLVHRDIKPDNIMFRDVADTPVLVDLGVARNLSETSLTYTWLPHGPGTPYYSAPEQLKNEKQMINWRTDQFSLGVVIGICLTGTHPFSEAGMSQGDVVANVANRASCTSVFVQRASDLGFDFVVKMLDPWPHRRYQSPAELGAAIRR